MTFDIREHLKSLIPAKGKNRYLCPVCEGNDFTIDPKDGAYQCWHGCESKNIRNAVAPVDLSDRGDFDRIRLEWKNKKANRIREQENRERQQKSATDSLDFAAIDAKIRQQWGHLRLKPSNRESLLKRGLSPGHINRGWFRSEPYRMICPAFWGEFITGYQWRSDGGSGPKYYWEKGKAHLPSGELPITVIGEPSTTANFIEGFLKPLIAQSKRGGLWIGAAGGHFPKNITQRAIQEFGVKSAIIWPDSDKGNLGPIKKLITLGDRLESQGIAVEFAYWGQLEGVPGDCDEIALDTHIRYLSLAEIKRKVSISERLTRIAKPKDKARFYELNSPRLPEGMGRYVHELKYLDGHKLICVSSAKKTRKTRAIVKPLMEYLKQDKKLVLALFGRVGLMLDSCREWGISARDDVDFRSLSHDFEISQGYQIGQVFDSLLKCGDIRWDVVILDEIHTLLKHLYTADTEIKNKRPQIIAKFVQILTNAEMVVALDADLTSDDIRHLEYLCGLATGEGFLILNHGRPDDGEVITFYEGNPGSIRESFLSRAKNDDKVIYFTDSRTEAEALDRLCQQLGIRSAVWSSDTVGQPEVKAQMANPNKWLTSDPPQVLFITPVAMIGVSLEVPYFDIRICHSVGVIEPSAFRQLMGRYRPQVATEVYAARSGKPSHKGPKSQNPETVKRQIIQNGIEGMNPEDLARALAFDSSQGEADADAPDWVDLLKTWKDSGWESCVHLNKTATILADINFASRNNAELLKAELMDEGYSLVLMQGEKSVATESVATAKEEIKEEIASYRWEGYEYLHSLDDARITLEDKAATRPERERAMGVILREEMLPGFPADPDFILENWVKKPKFINQAKLGYFLERPELTRLIDGSKVKSTLGQLHKAGMIFAPDLALTGPKIRLLRDLGILEIINAEQFKTSEDDPIIGPFWERAREKYYLMDRIFGIHITEKSKPGKILGTLLEKIGLGLETLAKGKTDRKYRVSSPESRPLMFSSWDKKYSKMIEFVSTCTSPESVKKPQKTLVPVTPNLISISVTANTGTSPQKTSNLISIETCAGIDKPSIEHRFSADSGLVPTEPNQKPDAIGLDPPPLIERGPIATPPPFKEGDRVRLIYNGSPRTGTIAYLNPAQNNAPAIQLDREGKYGTAPIVQWGQVSGVESRASDILDLWNQINNLVMVAPEGDPILEGYPQGDPDETALREYLNRLEIAVF